MKVFCLKLLLPAWDRRACPVSPRWCQEIAKISNQPYGQSIWFKISQKTLEVVREKTYLLFYFILNRLFTLRDRGEN